MKDNEQQQIAKTSDWYLTKQLDFDKRLIRMRYQSIRPYLQGPEGLELGPAEGEMTHLLQGDFTRLTVVDGAEKLLACIPDAPNLVKIVSLFEGFQPDQKFNTIIMEHVLEHVKEPVVLLRRAKQWLAPGARLIAGVPNGHSIHRLAAVKMGLLKNPCDLNQRDLALGHRRVYSPETLKRDLTLAELRIVKTGGVFFKPLSNQQIQDHWTEEMIQGFFELGKDFPTFAAEIYSVCELP